MEFKLDHSYVVRDIDRQSDPYIREDRQITEFLIRGAIAKKYPEVKERTAQRMISRISNALNKAVNKKEDKIELTEDQVIWLRDLLREHAPNGTTANWFIDLFDYVEALTEKKDEKKVVAS